MPHEITLLYSNRTPEDAAFLSDFEKYEKINPHFDFMPVMTKPSPDEWNGESGHIDEQMLRRNVTDINKPIYYLSGPERMVEGMLEMLVKAGVNEDSIRTEEFTGY